MSVPGYEPFYNTHSPYRFTKINDLFMGYYIHRPVPPHVQDTLARVDHRYHHRPDLLAFDLYGTPDLFWIIPVRNGFEDPIFDLIQGKNIWVPNPTYVETLV